MSLKDREYMQTPAGRDGEERPPKPKTWVVAMAIILVLLFLMFLLLPLVRN